jgi:hypothetical protein
MQLSAREAKPSLESIESHIRAGRFGCARAELAIIRRLAPNLPREPRVLMASLYRRAGAANLGLRLLHAIVAPGSARRAALRPLTAELCEYGALLQRVGADHEAMRIFDQIDPREAPQALLFRAFGLMRRWEYAAAAPLLESYSADPSLTDYQRAVVRVNLAAAWVETGRPDAEALLDDLKTRFSAESFRLLRVNVLELDAERLMRLGQCALARDRVVAARQALGEGHSIDSLSLDKLLAALDGSSERLATIREALARACAWENARDCDHQLALLTKDSDLLARLSLGTPHEAYRQRLRREFNLAALPSEYLLNLGPVPGATASNRMAFDAEELGRSLGEGKVLHRLFLALVADFYRPARVAEIYERVFAERHFDPRAAEAVVYQAIYRLRRMLQRQKLPFVVVKSKGAFRLESLVSVVLRLRAPPRSALSSDLLLECSLRRLRAKFATRADFSRKEAEAALEMHSRTTKRLLRASIASGRATKTGKGPASRYRLLGELKS